MIKLLSWIPLYHFFSFFLVVHFVGSNFVLGFVLKHSGTAKVLFTEDAYGKRFYMYFASGNHYKVYDHRSIVTMNAAEYAIGAQANLIWILL